MIEDRRIVIHKKHGRQTEPRELKHRTHLRQLLLLTAFAIGLPTLGIAQQNMSPQDRPIKVSLFELGGQVSDMQFSGTCFDGPGCTIPQLGLGVGASINVAKDFSIESVLNLSTNTGPPVGYFTDGSIAGGRLTEALAGPRAEVRGKRYGFFLDAKAGAISWSHVQTGFSLTTNSNGTPIEVLRYGRRTFFATQVGGGFEYLANPRVHVRIDAGDVIVRYDDSNTVFCNACTRWTNSFRTSTGVYVGVGKLKDWGPSSSERAGSHDFWSEYTALALGTSLLAQTADAITTQRLVSHGKSEADPIARPLVKYGWSGQIGLGVLTNTAEVGLMYGLHNFGQHRIERAVPMAAAGLSGYAAYHNTQVSTSFAK